MKKDNEKAKELSFEERYKSFKEGKGEAPVIHKSVSFKSINDDEKLVVMSVEEIDSDGEIVEMEGGKIRNKENGIPMIDSHDSWSSVTSKALGSIRNPRFKTIDGKKCLVGEPDFAPTPNGEIAKILYLGVDGKKPFLTDVSMGFMVFDYDNKTGRIKEWEVFECSLVTAGANRSARFTDKKDLSGEAKKEFKEAVEKDAQDLKDLIRFKQINPVFKEFTKLFFSEEFCKKIGYEKDGDMILDLNAIYDTIVKSFNTKVEAPQSTQEAPKPETKQPKVSSDDVQKALMEAITARLK